jgi:hypothetical protein
MNSRAAATPLSGMRSVVPPAFSDVCAETIESEQITANGAPTRRYSIIMTGRG